MLIIFFSNNKMAKISSSSLPYRQLRNIASSSSDNFSVHCRTGSLEINRQHGFKVVVVHCRTGSLEKLRAQIAATQLVHCRAGSLEI